MFTREGDAISPKKIVWLFEFGKKLYLIAWTITKDVFDRRKCHPAKCLNKDYLTISWSWSWNHHLIIWLKMSLVICHKKRYLGVCRELRQSFSQISSNTSKTHIYWGTKKILPLSLWHTHTLSARKRLRCSAGEYGGHEFSLRYNHTKPKKVNQP